MEITRFLFDHSRIYGTKEDSIHFSDMELQLLEDNSFSFSKKLQYIMLQGGHGVLKGLEQKIILV